MFGLAAWGATAAPYGQENPINSILDPDITTQNNNFIFTGPYNLLADMAVGSNITAGRYSVAQWNGRGRPAIFAVNANANPTAPIYWGQRGSQKLALPQNQQIQPYLTNGATAGTVAQYILWKIATSDWTANQPPGLYDLIGHATSTVVPVVGSWVTSQTIAFDQLPLGGVYAVIGARVFGSNGIAFRLNFPRTRMYQGRRLRPGDVILGALGDAPPLYTSSGWGDDGVYGFFHTFELPTLDILGTSAVSTKYDIYMHLRFLGEPVSILDQMVSSSY